MEPYHNCFALRIAVHFGLVETMANSTRFFHSNFQFLGWRGIITLCAIFEMQFLLWYCITWITVIDYTFFDCLSFVVGLFSLLSSFGRTTLFWSRHKHGSDHICHHILNSIDDVSKLQINGSRRCDEGNWDRLARAKTNTFTENVN